jgi:chlorite dismutase
MSIPIYTFSGALAGNWRVAQMDSILGPALEPVPFLNVTSGTLTSESKTVWSLRGVVSHERYVNRTEKNLLAASSPVLGRSQDVCAALIPIKKSEAWWSLPQDERRAILEEQSQHISVGLKYVPAIARRLHHSRDLGEPFDFLTWFEFAPEHIKAFEELVTYLRTTAEWKYVVREVDLRLRRV